MAATLSVTYTPNYIGNHRICFRTTGSAYCCYNDDSASVIGVPKTTVIELEDFEFCLGDLPQPIGCSGSVVEGYVQPICIEQSSDVNRVEFTATYPSTECTPYNILCEESGIAEITVTDQGYGWLPGEVPTVTITDLNGVGIGATATAVMRCDPTPLCVVDSIIIDTAGEFYYDINQIIVDIAPPPSAGGELVVNGDFTSNLNGWNLYNPGDGFATWSSLYSGSAFWNPGDVNIGIYQDILTVGHTYTVNLSFAIVPNSNPNCIPFEDSQVAFDIYAGTAHYGPLTFSGQQDFTFDITCTGNTQFRIECINPNNCVTGMYCSFASVVDVIEGLPAEAQVTAVDDCGTFTVADCDGTDNPTEYQLWGGEQYAINVCSGGTGPEAFKYTVTPNPTYGGLGPELIVNGEFITNLSGWTPDNTSSVVWSSDYGGSANFGASDSLSIISQDILTVGNTYTVNIDLAINFNGTCTSGEKVFTQFNIYAGTAVYGPLNFSGTQSFTFDITCVDNITFSIQAWDPNSCTYSDVTNIAQMFCSYVSVKGQGTPIAVSCCDCVKYEVINTALTGSPIEFYYTDCIDQVITTQSINPQQTIEICAVRNSIWPVNPNDNQYLEYILSATQDC